MIIFETPDMHRGGWLRDVREALGLSQRDIMARMSPPFTIQDLDAYEYGLISISATQLHQLCARSCRYDQSIISKLLDVSLA